MIHYEVTAVPEPSVRDAYESYMREVHIRDVLMTGCFVAARIEAAEAGRYRTTYVAARREDLDRYLEHHTQRLRAEFSSHFPSGIALSREVWEVLQEWQIA